MPVSTNHCGAVFSFLGWFEVWFLICRCDIIYFASLLDPPSVTIQQCSAPLTEGDNVTLHCNATGNPVPNTAFIKAGEVLSYNKGLVVVNISRDEGGSYECLAWNGIGNNDTTSCTVDVQCKLLHCFFF